MKKFIPIIVAFIVGASIVGIGIYVGNLIVNNESKDCVCEEKECNLLDGITFDTSVDEEILSLLGITNEDGKYISSNNSFNDSLKSCYLKEEQTDISKCLLDEVIKEYGEEAESDIKGYFAYKIYKDDLMPYLSMYNISEDIVTYDDNGYVFISEPIIAGGYFAEKSHHFIMKDIGDGEYEITDLQVITNKVNDEFDGFKTVKYNVSKTDTGYVLNYVG